MVGFSNLKKSDKLDVLDLNVNFIGLFKKQMPFKVFKFDLIRKITQY